MNTTIRVNNNTRKNVMKAAWSLVRNNGMSLSEALKAAWLNVKIKVGMYANKVAFTFKKKSGEIRHAIGTLCREFGAVTANTGATSSPRVQVFFDVEKGAWRSYLLANIISIG